MSDIEKAKRHFCQANLTFPSIPDKLAVHLRQRDNWVFSTRDLPVSPYVLQAYVGEGEGSQAADYAILAHSGHGVNSYAIQYYLVYGGLRMFLHLGWGGVYMNSDTATSMVVECFSLADRILLDTTKSLAAEERLMIVGSDFYGSYWLKPGQKIANREEFMESKEVDAAALVEDSDEHLIIKPDMKDPVAVLKEVVQWLEKPDRTEGSSGGSIALDP